MSHSPPARFGTSHGTRVVAFDLDGTILEPGERIQDDVLHLLRQLSAHGIRCVTATGRPIEFQLELLTRYALADGSGIFHALVADERELYLRQNGTFTPDQQWNGWIRVRWRARVQEALQWIQEAHREATRRGMTARIAPATEIAARGLAALRFDDPEPAEAICAWLASRLSSSDSRLACNRNIAIVQVYDSAAGKASVLARLATVWEIRPEEILAIGDSANDQDMLDGSHGFRCATVANATGVVKSAVQAAGGYVARAVSGAGVVEAVRALVPEASNGWLEQETETHAHRTC